MTSAGNASTSKYWEIHRSWIEPDRAVELAGVYARIACPDDPGRALKPNKYAKLIVPPFPEYDDCEFNDASMARCLVTELSQIGTASLTMLHAYPPGTVFGWHTDKLGEFESSHGLTDLGVKILNLMGSATVNIACPSAGVGSKPKFTSYLLNPGDLFVVLNGPGLDDRPPHQVIAGDNYRLALIAV